MSRAGSWVSAFHRFEKVAPTSRPVFPSSSAKYRVTYSSANLNFTSLHNNFQYTTITSVLAMNNDSASIVNSTNPGPIGALILVPIAIIGSVVIIAIKTPTFWHRVTKRCKERLPKLRRQREKEHRSDLATLQDCPDSWYDLENTLSQANTAVIQQSPSEESPSPSKIWHPGRSSRLKWSFGRNRQSHHLSRSESSKSVQKPLPVLAAPEKAQIQDEHPTTGRMRPSPHPRTHTDS